MGVDAYIKFGRVNDDLHKLDLEKHPIVKITKPIAIVPYHVSSFAGKFPVYSTYHKELDEFLSYQNNQEDIQAIELNLDWGPIFLSRDLFATELQTTYDEFKRDGVGAIPLIEQEKHWDDFTEGYWTVLHAYRVGMSDEDRNYSLPVGVKPSKTIDMRLYT